MYLIFFKRLIDVTSAFLILILFSPLFLGITCLLALTTKSFPFFFQKRIGEKEKQFEIIKFKSMTDHKDDQGNLLPDGQRLTFFGKIIRKASLDELPQLINILKGDMSFIGPRPLLNRYLPYYTEEERIRHTIKPGITGLAQINGRNFLSWNKKFEYDIEYVKKISLKLDIIITLKTIKKIIKSEDIIVNPKDSQVDLDEERKNHFNK